MTVCDLVHCAYSKNFNLVNDDKRPMLRTLHQRRLWKRLQKAFADTNDDESLAMSRVLPEAFRNYQGATAQKEQVAEHESQQQQQQQQQEQEQEQEESSGVERDPATEAGGSLGTTSDPDDTAADISSGSSSASSSDIDDSDDDDDSHNAKNDAKSDANNDAHLSMEMDQAQDIDDNNVCVQTKPTPTAMAASSSSSQASAAKTIHCVPALDPQPMTGLVH